MSGEAPFEGTLMRRGEDGYEAARRASCWNAMTPARFPDAILRAADEADVVRGVRLAREEGWRIGVRSGGHSWAGNHVRDGGLLLDLSQLDGVDVDAASRTARVGPGVHGDALLSALENDRLFFPAGHCPGVGLGGYLLQGGYGWNGRVHGPACMSVEAVELVTADGEQVIATENEHADLLWAARGSGPGFFAAVTRFHLRLYPAPAVVANAVYIYPLEMIDEVYTWAHAIGPRVDPCMELMLLLHHDEAGAVQIAVAGPVLAANETQASGALSVLETCPVRDQALLAAPDVRVGFPELYAGAAVAYPDGHRYCADNLWTHATAGELVPHLRAMAESMPEAPSHVLWMNWSPASGPPRPDMAYSVEDDTYVALYAVWSDPTGDEANIAWTTEHAGTAATLASGIQLADENLGRRPARFVSDANLAKLDELRVRHDPDGRFHPWMGRA